MKMQWQNVPPFTWNPICTVPCVSRHFICGRSMTDLVTRAGDYSSAITQEDLAAFEERNKEPEMS